MCWHNHALQQDLETYDMVKYIGGVLGFDMVDLMDLMTYNPNVQTEEDIDSWFSEFDNIDNTVTMEYSVEVDNDELDSMVNEADDNDDDDSIIDLTVDGDDLTLEY